MGDEVGLSVVLVRQIARGVGALGGEADVFLRRLGVEPSTQGSVSGDLVVPAIEAIALEMGQPNLGLALAGQLRFGQLGLVEYCVATSADLREGLQRSCRFFGLLSTRARLTLEESGGVARLVQRMRPGAPHVRHLTDLTFAHLALSMQTLVSGSVEIHAMKFAYTERDAREHVGIFGPCVSFGAPFDVLELDAAALSRPLLTSDPIVASILEQQAVKLHAELVPEGPLLDGIRASVAKRLITRSHSLAATACDLDVPRRTLQRRLAAQTTSYREVVDSVRRELATEWVSRKDTAHAEIAYALGFSDPTAFYRAFRRWTGMTAESFARSHGKGPRS